MQLKALAPDEGSSRMTIDGEPSNAMPTCNFRFIPPDSAAAGASTFFARSTASAIVPAAAAACGPAEFVTWFSAQLHHCPAGAPAFVPMSNAVVMTATAAPAWPPVATAYHRCMAEPSSVTSRRT